MRIIIIDRHASPEVKKWRSICLHYSFRLQPSFLSFSCHHCSHPLLFFILLFLCHLNTEESCPDTLRAGKLVSGRASESERWSSVTHVSKVGAGFFVRDRENIGNIWAKNQCIPHIIPMYCRHNNISPT